MEPQVLSDYILTLHDAVPASLCDKILLDYQNGWRSPGVVLQTQYAGKELEGHIQAALQDYRNRFSDFCCVGYIESCQVLRYPEGSYCTKHADYIEGRQRVLTCSLQLNEGFEGGEFRFFGEYIPPLRKGTALLFPATFQYPHEVLPVRRGERYAVITWIW